jgi:uncharacterized protein YdhG (YjbR/CyaY superfamily)
MNDVEKYISGFSGEVKLRMKNVRGVVLKCAPGSVEEMAYGMPGYKLNGKPLVYFGAFKNHIGFYATPSGHKKFEKELDGYKQGKGSVQFPLDESLPIELIKKLVEFRVKENNAK